jgi:phosphonate transport system substrate-binding protein
VSLCHKALATVFWVVLSFSALAEDVYKFSVVPQFEVRRLFSIWQPVIDEIQQRTGLKFELVTALSVTDYEKEVMAGRYDFIFINPYLMPIVADKPGYVPLVRDSMPLRGILVVRKDSPIQRVEDLQDKTLAVPSMTALGASLLLRAELDRQFNVKPRALVAKTHSSVFLHVINGLADAGGSVQKALAEQDPRIRDALKVLYQTGEVPSHPVAAHQRVPVAVRESVRQAFIEISKDEAGRKLLADIPMQAAISTRIEDYDVLRTLRLDKYMTQ